MCKTDSQWEPDIQHRELSSMLCGDQKGEMGEGEAQEREDICIHIADSLRCTVETNIIL